MIRATSAALVTVLVLAPPLAMGKPAGPAADRPAASCARQLSALDEAFRRSAQEAERVAYQPVSPGFEPPRLGGGSSPAGDLTIVEHGLAITSIEGRALDRSGAPGELLEKIEEAQRRSTEQWQLLHPGQRPPKRRIGVWIDRRVSAPEAFRLLEGLTRDGEVDLLFATAEETGKKAPPPPVHVAERLAAIRATTDAAAKAAAISAGFTAALAGCKSGSEAQDASDTAAPGQAIRKRLQACGCVGADLPMLVALAAPDPQLVRVQRRAIRIVKAARAAVTATSGRTFQEALAGLPARGALTLQWKE